MPAGVNYDLWLGPAAERPFNVNRFHYNWHWNWDYGGGEAANNGVHVLDAAIQGLDKQTVFPTQIGSQGGRFAWHDQGETPNTQTANFPLRRRHACSCWRSAICLRTTKRDFSVGVIFYGSKGYLALNHCGAFETVVDGQPGPKGTGGGAHAELLANFYSAVRSRQAGDLLAPLQYGRTAAGLCHLANISYRLGRSVEFDAASESFPHDAGGGRAAVAHHLSSRIRRCPTKCDRRRTRRTNRGPCCRSWGKPNRRPAGGGRQLAIVLGQNGLSAGQVGLLHPDVGPDVEFGGIFGHLVDPGRNVLGFQQIFDQMGDHQIGRRINRDQIVGVFHIRFLDSLRIAIVRVDVLAARRFGGGWPGRAFYSDGTPLDKPSPTGQT